MAWKTGQLCNGSVKLQKNAVYSELYIKKEGIEIFFIVTDIIILYNQYPWLLSNSRVLLSVDPCHRIIFLKLFCDGKTNINYLF